MTGRRDIAIEELARRLHEAMDQIECATPEPVAWENLEDWDKNYCRKCVRAILSEPDAVLRAIPPR
jgi:hypothetical protein